MKLYNLTLQRPTGITHAVHGNFSGVKLQEIIVSRGRMLELLKPDPNTGKVHTLLTTEIFGVVRSLMSFRLTGGNKDYVIVGSDSGRICILEYQPTKNVFERVHIETFGKSGCRRIVPGQYLAIDPKVSVKTKCRVSNPSALRYLHFYKKKSRKFSTDFRDKIPM